MTRLLRVTVAAVLVLLAAFALSAGPAHGSSPQTVKVFVVGTVSPDGTVPDTLASIAAATLGDPSGASQIFALNQSRLQGVTSADQELPGRLVLLLPSAASGPDVRLASVAAPPPAQTSHQTSQRSSHQGRGRDWTAIVLAVIGGIVLLIITLLIALRHQAARVARAAAAARRRAADRITGPSRRRRSRLARSRLAREWRSDPVSAALARTALTNAGQALPASTSRPVAADVSRAGVLVTPMPPVEPPPLWQRSGSGWLGTPVVAMQVNGGGDELCRPIRVGGEQHRQVFIDLSHCDGVLSLAGDTRTAAEILNALLDEISADHPDLKLASLGRAAGTTGARHQLRHSSELAALIDRPTAQFDDAPLRAAARRRRLTGVVAIPDGTPATESAEVARLCSVPGSTWMAVAVGDIPGAHWRWEARPDGTVSLPLIRQTVIAAM
jgi:hypothetical protein